MRALPAPSSRPAAKGHVLYVNSSRGDDAGTGEVGHPWKTLGKAFARLQPGDTLYVAGGTYFESATLTVKGTAAAPITIRSAPGELAIIDGGVRAFWDSPASAWQPSAGGASDEFESTAAFPDLDRASDDGRGVWVLGNFGDSLIPLHGYRFREDFRAANEVWTVANSTPGDGVYLGPGLWFDWSTGKIHIRLSHTAIAAQGDGNYAGETDPRRMPLVIGVDHSALRLVHCAHVRLQDLELRGSAVHTLDISDSDDVELDHLAIFGGSPGVEVHSTSHFKFLRSTLRGIAAPWSSRASMKYRGNSPYLFVADSKGVQSTDWEIAFDELTDGHDGVIVDSIKHLRFHHNLVDNLNDDGIYLTFPPRASVPEDIQIYENYISRVQTSLAFAEADDKSPNSIGPGVYVFRNVFDLRESVYAFPPKQANGDEQRAASRTCGDHGSPTWEPLFFYQNTVVSAAKLRGHYGAQLVIGTKGSKRRVLDNIFIQLVGLPGALVPRPDDDIQLDGNLAWSGDQGAGFHGDLFAKLRGLKPPLAVHDVFGDPRLAHATPADTTLDVRLSEHSAAIDAGVPVPGAWPDPLHQADRGAPDIGALPFGAPMFSVGPAASSPLAP